MSLSRVGKGVDGWRVFGNDDDRHLVLDALMVVGPLERIVSCHRARGSHSMFILRLRARTALVVPSPCSDALMVVGPLERIMSYNGGGSHSMFILREYVVLKEMA